MSHPLIFRARVRNGNLALYDPSEYLKALRVLEGKDVIVQIRRRELSRSTKQNALYWAYLGEVSAETGHDENELHEFFKRRFLPPRFITITIKGKSQEMKVPASTTMLSIGEFSEYLSRIQVETGVPIPSYEVLS